MQIQIYSEPRAVAPDRQSESESLVELALAHWAAGSPTSAIQACAAAVATDQSSIRARAAHEWLQAAAVANLTTRPFDGRGFITLADGARVIQNPELLTSYGAQFSSEDDASLLIVVSPDDVQALSQLVEETGLTGSDAADLTALVTDQPFVSAAVDLAPHVHALLESDSVCGLGEYRVSADRDGLRFLHALARRRAAALTN